LEIRVKDTFTTAQLERLKALPYKPAHLVHLLSEKSDLSDPFTRYVLALEERRSLAYNDMMVTFDGDPTGIEFQHRTQDNRWAFTLPDASVQGSWRIQYFDWDSFVSHHCERTFLACIDSMAQEGFVVADPGALDRLSVTPRWKRGVEVSSLIQRLNAREITHERFSQLQAELGA